MWIGNIVVFLFMLRKCENTNVQIHCNTILGIFHVQITKECKFLAPLCKGMDNNNCHIVEISISLTKTSSLGNVEMK